MCGVEGPALARTRRSLARIEALDPMLHSCILVRPEALDEAARGDRSAPLSGWTVGVKDNTDVAGTVRSDGLGEPLPEAATSDAVAVARLRAAGAVVVAKTNLEQLSFGATTQNPTWGACRNPWDLGRIPGGSSGGSAVAVAADLVDVALGTDTGGSLRNPASFCGVSALRPTHGLVPTTGVTALSPSMDVVGPMARRVRDLAPVLAALGGTSHLAHGLSLDGLSVGVPDSYFVDGLEDDVARSFDELLTLLRDQGARLTPVALARASAVPDSMSTVQNAEAARSLRAYWDDERLSDGIRARLDLGRSVTGTQLRSAAAEVDAWCRTVLQTLADVTVIVTPATPFVAPLAGADDLVALSRRINRFTGCWSPVGTPALALPLQPSRARLPIGGQVIGSRGADWTVLAVGQAIQSVSDWHEHLPPLAR